MKNHWIKGDVALTKYEPWHSGRNAVVTGGASGIGLASALRLQARGATVAIGSRRFSDHGIASEVAKTTGVHCLALDICDQGSVDTFTTTVGERLGPIDILVNSAGISVHQSVCGHSMGDWLRVMDTNLNGAFRMTRACLPTMIDREWGRIVNVASTAASNAAPEHAAYCASKAGLLGLTRAVALEGAAHGVTCTAVSPTWVETEMLRRSAATMAQNEGTTQAYQIESLSRANPQNRLVQVDEVAELISFLASEKSPALTMEDVQINAGAYW